MDILPAVRALHIAATVVLAGGWDFRLLLVPAGAAGAGGVRTPRAFGAWALVVALATWAGWLAAVAVDMSGLPVAQALAPQMLATVAMRTTFGQVWLLRAGLLLMLAALQWRADGPRGFEWLAAFVAACALASLAGSGHALGAHFAHLVVDAVHAVAAGLWLGMLPLLWWTIHRALTVAPADAQLAVRAARRFAVPGAAAVVALAATGALNAWWLVGSPGDLLASRYGLLVLAKIGLSIAMVLLALVNRFVLVPRLDGGTREALRSLRRTVLGEIALGLLVLATVGVLGVTPPAPRVHADHPMHNGM